MHKNNQLRSTTCVFYSYINAFFMACAEMSKCRRSLGWKQTMCSHGSYLSEIVENFCVEGLRPDTKCFKKKTFDE